ncbi:MAG: calcium-binding EGF-like domain-containing protein [Chitinophagia bacterium]
MKIIIIPFLFISFYIHAQVVPIGTVIIGKRLPTLTANSTSYMYASFATLSGSIKINDSKLTIIEKGFIVLPNSDNRVPDISNSTKYIVGAVSNDFENTYTFNSNTTYKYRSYAKNSKGEYAYSRVSSFTTSMNPCEINPCKNGGACSFDFENTILTCECVEPFGGDCCASLSNNYGGSWWITSGTNTCNAYFQQIASSKKTQKFKLTKFDENLDTNYTWFVPQVINNQLSMVKIGK